MTIDLLSARRGNFGRSKSEAHTPSDLFLAIVSSSIQLVEGVDGHQDLDCTYSI